MPLQNCLHKNHHSDLIPEALFRIWNDCLKARELRDCKTVCEKFVYKVNQHICSFHETSLRNLDSKTGIGKNVGIANRYFSNVS